uniref:Mediator of RNA polymerase II transcription subunit 17 n=1 Tax=Panagrellus redivivus TaxID=6233 RepID=A0A7E4VBQ4_PANRE
MSRRQVSKLFFEPVIENQVVEYSYDGTEKHAPKATLNETTADMARRIDWRTIIGPDDTLEPLYSLRNLRISNETPEVSLEESDAQHAEKVKDMLEPDAGPWALVAKQLHTALAEVNNLLDVVRIAKDGNGIKVASVAPNSDGINKVADEAASAKVFTWTANRKALIESRKVFQPFIESRRDVADLDLFYKELREIRKFYVVRKNGECLVGDLGYRTYGNKWIPAESFDIFRVEECLRSKGIKHNDERVKTMVEVDVPRHLAVRTSLFVTIVFDGTGDDLFEKRDIRMLKKQPNNGNPPSPDGEINEDMLEEMESNGEKPNLSRMAYWMNALRWARETLVYRDLFTQLTRECASLVGRSCSIKDNIIVINLFENVMLKIEKCESPFVDGELAEHGNAFLKGILKAYFYDELRTPPYKPSVFVSLPNQRTTLPDAMLGPFATEAYKIEKRCVQPKPLVMKILAVASHYFLVKKVTEDLLEFQRTYGDPVLSWKWQRVTTENSLMHANFYLRGQDAITQFTIRITTDDIEIVPRDGHPISCGRDNVPFNMNLHLQRANFLLAMTVTLVTRLNYKLLQLNINQQDSNGRPAPTIFILNSNATRQIFIQFFSNGATPSIATRQILDYVPDDASEFDLKDADFTPIDLDRIPGSSFMKQVDNLLSFLNN